GVGGDPPVRRPLAPAAAAPGDAAVPVGPKIHEQLRAHREKQVFPLLRYSFERLDGTEKSHE
ncbi:unnamed protein product, partial [Urochloa humidicola]